MENDGLAEKEKEEKRLTQLRELASSPLPRVFKPWMRAMDPTLELEDTNPWFEAFRRRRLYLKNRSLMENLGARLLRGVSELLPILGGIALVLLFIFFGLFACFFLLAGSILFKFIRRRKLKSGLFPERVGEVFGTMGYQHQCVLDLWLAGATGKELLQAIYLEGREKQSSHSISRFVAVLVVLLMPFVVYMSWMGVPALFQNPVLLFGLIVTIAAVPEIHLWIWVSTMRSHITNPLTGIIRFWEGDTLAAYSHWWTVDYPSVYILIAVVFIIVELIAWFLVAQYWFVPSMNFIWLIVFLHVVGVVGFLRLCRGNYIRGSLGELESLSRRADRAFLIFVATRVTEDLDLQVCNLDLKQEKSPGLPPLTPDKFL